MISVLNFKAAKNEQTSAGLNKVKLRRILNDYFENIVFWNESFAKKIAFRIFPVAQRYSTFTLIILKIIQSELR